MSKYFNASSLRLSRYLYALGFQKQSFINKNGIENWKFEHSSDLQESLDFYFYMRNKNKIGVNENGKKSRENQKDMSNLR